MPGVSFKVVSVRQGFSCSVDLFRLLGGSVVKNPPINGGDTRDAGLIPGEGNGHPLQYSCLENPHGQRSLAGCSLGGHRLGYDLATPPTSFQGYFCPTWLPLEDLPAS